MRKTPGNGEDVFVEPQVPVLRIKLVAVCEPQPFEKVLDLLGVIDAALVADLERFPVDANRDSQEGEEGRVLRGDWPMRGSYGRTLFVGFTDSCC